MICKWCGEKIIKTDRICRSCGSELPPLSENGGFKCTLIVDKSKEVNDTSVSNSPIEEKTADKNKPWMKMIKKNMALIAISILAVIFLVQTVIFSSEMKKINSRFEKVSVFARTEEIELNFNFDDLKKSKVTGIATCNGTPLWNEIEYTSANGITNIAFALDILNAKGKISIKFEGDKISIEEEKFKLDEFGEQHSFNVKWEHLNGEMWKNAGEGIVYENKQKHKIRCVITRKSTDGGSVTIIINGLQLNDNKTEERK